MLVNPLKKMDPWNQGREEWKPGLWATYTTLNYLGSFLCLLVLRSLWVLRERTRPHDVFMACLLLGCLLMGLPCATQCFINRVNDENRFEFGWTACWWEAYFHLAAIQMQFFGVALVAGHHYFSVVWRKSLSVSWAILISLSVFVCCAGGTYAMGTISEVVLMPAGAYCFYTFTSPLIKFWFTPGMLLALVLVCFFYARIFCFVAETDKKVAPMQQQQPSPSSFARPTADTRPGSAQTVPKRVVFAKRTVVYVLVFLAGWGPAVVACIYTVWTGELTQELDITLAMFGSLHTVAVPLVYGRNTQQFRDWLFINGCCWDAKRVVVRRGKRFVIRPRSEFVVPQAGDLKIVVDTVAAVDGSPIQASPDPAVGVSSSVTWTPN